MTLRGVYRLVLETLLMLFYFHFPSCKERGQKKTGLCGKNSQTGGGGLTQTHFLMSIYQVIFGMPKWPPTNLACHLP